MRCPKSTITKLDLPCDVVLAELLADIRCEDADELDAHGPDRMKLLRTEVNNSSEVFEGRRDGALVALWGVTPSPNGKSCGAWMFSTNAATKFKRDVLIGSELFVEHLLNQYDKVYVEVDERYKKAVRWLTYLGFEPLMRTTHGEQDLPFIIMIAR